MRFLIGLVLAAAIAAGAAFFIAGRQPGPTVEFVRPEKFVGASTPVEFTVAAPATQLSSLVVTLEQNGKSHQIYSLGAAGAELKEEPDGKTRVTTTVGKEQVPDLASGPARIEVKAAKPTLYGMRTLQHSATKDVQVRLERPRVAVVSTHHFVNHGGAEAVVYRATPEYSS